MTHVNSQHRSGCNTITVSFILFAVLKLMLVLMLWGFINDQSARRGTLCDAGTINDEARRRQEEIRSKLQSVDARARPGFDQAKDYYTSEEAAKFMKPKKKVQMQASSCLCFCLISLLYPACLKTSSQPDVLQC